MRAGFAEGGISMYETPKFLGSGESCLVVEFSDGIDMEANERLQGLRRVLSGKKITGMLELVPTYRSLSVHYNPLSIDRTSLEKKITRALEEIADLPPARKRVLVLPVAYGGDYGPDLGNVANLTGLDEDEVVRRHTGRDCYCFMTGFTPGFSYLGGMDESIAAPRLDIPRTLVPPGSVGIAGRQTGVYGIESPGGWQLIGRTPLRLFDPWNERSPTIIDAGDLVRFKKISAAEFDVMKRDIASSRFEIESLFEDDASGDARCR
jgi:KipI family sensor histidine kinase inhibitor